MPQPTTCFRWLYELSFSIYLALLVVTEEATKVGSSFLGKLGYPLLEWVYPLLARLLHRARFEPGLGLHTVVLWWLLTVIFVLCLRVLGRIAVIRTVLRQAAGFVIVAGFPLVWLHPGNQTGLLLATREWLLIEVVFVVACVCLFLYRRWPKGAALGVLVLLLHSGLWGWVSWGAITVGSWSVYLVLGSCTGLVWGFYVRMSAGCRPPAEAPVAK
jgi:hypothetical protein